MFSEGGVWEKIKWDVYLAPYRTNRNRNSELSYNNK